MSRPDDVRYTESHEWARLENGVLTLGVTDFAVEHLGDIVFVDLPSPGKQVRKGETVCEIESVKAVGEVYAPVAGKVKEANASLGDDPAPLASDPFGAGWLVKLEVGAGATLDGLMDRAAYEKHLETAEAE